MRAIRRRKESCCEQEHVLLLGESGTGKELFARAIHNWSERKDRPFIAINCVGLSKELLESELFGYERELLPALPSSKEERLKSPMVVRSFSMKSAISPRSFRPSCCDSFRSGSLSGWVAPS